MITRLAKKIAQQHIELRYPQQPLRLQPDYGERNAADFLGDLDADEVESFETTAEMLKESEIDRMAKDHEQSGSYMSRQNLREIDDMADFIIDDIGMSDLDDWVEDKISHAHSALNDVARYRGYRDDHPHGEKEQSFRFAGDEIIDDIGIMAELDKESKVKSHKHHSPKDVKDSYEKQKKKFGPEWAKYEGAMGPDGLDPARIKKNESGMGGKSKSKPSGMTALDRLANDYNIIDDLEW